MYRCSYEQKSVLCILYHSDEAKWDCAPRRRASKGTVLYNEAAFQELKDAEEAAFQEQEKEYGSMKDKLIVGKDSLVDFLKSYRDSLRDMVDMYAEMASSFE